MSTEAIPTEVALGAPQDSERLSYASPEVPFHFSVGIVALSSLHPSKARVATLYSPPEYANPFGVTDFDQLVRETPDNGESLQATVHRGLREEIGASEARIISPLPGETVDFWSHSLHQYFRKTTMYFLAEVAPGSIDESLRDTSEMEIDLRVVWRSLPEAIARQKAQKDRMLAHGRTDLIEDTPLEAAWQLLRRSPDRITRL